MQNKTAKLAAFERILTIMNELREQCPWDRKQTIDSLRILTIEETYELADAITEKDLQGIKEELGDLLMHIVFYAKIGEEKGAFDMAAVINTVCDKLIHRHPHIYGDASVKDEEEVLRNWEALKLKEGKQSALEGVPKSLPAVVKALRIQEKAKGVGFEWDTTTQVWDKVKEEMEELLEAVESGDQEEMTKEYGDLMFSLINYARFIKVDPENALATTNNKFISRFQKMESMAISQGHQLHDLSLAEMDVMWEEAKRYE